MFAVIMIVLNGLVGLCLILGGLRYRQQTLNLYSANTFLAVIIPLAVLVLVMPTFTISTPRATSSPLQSVFLIFMSVALYCTFLALQTRWHREYFIVGTGSESASLEDEVHYHGLGEIRSLPYHLTLLIAYMLPVLILAKQMAKPIDYGVSALGAPEALGGFIVAALILAPESLAAVRAALANHLQRAMNLSLGSVLASISLTIPAVLTIGFITDKSIILGRHRAAGDVAAGQHRDVHAPAHQRAARCRASADVPGLPRAAVREMNEYHSEMCSCADVARARRLRERGGSASTDPSRFG
jgi:Ca2+:H+ antiporter